MTSVAFQRLVRKFGVSWVIAALAVIASVLWGWKEHSAKKWPTVPGKVVRTSEHRSSERKSKTYYAHYTYVVNGTPHESRDEIGLLATGRSRNSTERHGITVYYNPSNPADSTISPGISSKTLFLGGIGLFWLLLFPVAWIDALRRKKANAAALQSAETV